MFLEELCLRIRREAGQIRHVRRNQRHPRVQRKHFRRRGGSEEAFAAFLFLLLRGGLPPGGTPRGPFAPADVAVTSAPIIPGPPFVAGPLQHHVKTKSRRCGPSSCQPGTFRAAASPLTTPTVAPHHRPGELWGHYFLAAQFPVGHIPVDAGAHTLHRGHLLRRPTPPHQA